MDELKAPRPEKSVAEKRLRSKGRAKGGKKKAKDDVKHDVYLLSENKQLYKFPVDPDGGYTREPEEPAYSEPNLRYIHNVANPGLTESPQRPRGPVFATLPLTAEPTPASVFTCYVINPNNLIYRNAYTAEEWFSPGAQETPGPSTPDDFKLLVAGPKGRIYLVEVTNQGEKSACRLLQPPELQQEMDLWDQLRNGTVVGRVLFGQDVVPMVNVTSIQPEGSAK